MAIYFDERFLDVNKKENQDVDKLISLLNIHKENGGDLTNLVIENDHEGKWFKVFTIQKAKKSTKKSPESV